MVTVGQVDNLRADW